MLLASWSGAVGDRFGLERQAAIAAGRLEQFADRIGGLNRQPYFGFRADGLRSIEDTRQRKAARPESKC